VVASAAPVDRVVDTTGAGDVFAAGLLHGLLAGAGIATTLAQAAVWAARAVQTEGSVPPADLCAGPGSRPPRDP
jgi:sugar/nucleoside kinase (ribokinase family)